MLEEKCHGKKKEGVKKEMDYRVKWIIGLNSQSINNP